jgi:hypothetical protein
MSRDETLTCQACHRSWSRITLRGRKPPLCPTCKRVRKPGVYGRDRSAGYVLRMAPEELEALKVAAAKQQSTIRDFVLVAALRAAAETRACLACDGSDCVCEVAS